MNINELKQVSKEILEVTSTLITGPNYRTTKFQKVLECIARKDFLKLYSVAYLAGDPFNADSVLDLSRSMLEDMISVEFMKLKGREKMASKFINYMIIELKMDKDFLLSLGSSPNGKLVEGLENDFKKIQKKFIFKSGQIARSWAKCSIEDMIRQLLTKGIINAKDRETILQTYILGNRKNHLSPIDVLSYASQSVRESNQDGSLSVGFTIAITCYFKIVMEFAGEMNRKQIINDLENIWNKMKPIYIVK